MSIVDFMKELQQTKLDNEDGRPFQLELWPPLPDAEIDELERTLGLPLPNELKKLLQFCRGIGDLGYIGHMDFTGGSMLFEFKVAFPSGVAVAADGYGNFWVLDITPETTEKAPVFFACHDAPVVLYQSPDLESFLREVFRKFVPPRKSLVGDVQEDRLFDVLGKNPGAIEQPVAAQSEDATLRAFAATLADHFKILDLRDVPVGMGFSWARYGLRTEVKRHGYERIFAYGRPLRRGLFAWLFGE